MKKIFNKWSIIWIITAVLILILSIFDKNFTLQNGIYVSIGLIMCFIIFRIIDYAK